MHSNFDFVQETHPHFFELLSSAEHFIGDDACCFLLKVRLALELWCYEFADLKSVELCVDSTLAEKIDTLQSAFVLPEQLVSDLKLLRRLCNEGVHIRENNRGQRMVFNDLSKAQMTQALKCLFELMVYVVRFQNSDAQIPAWRIYPSINFTKTLYEASQGDGDACADIAAYLFNAEAATVHHFGHFKSEDISYWLRKGLRHQSVKAATLMASLVLDHKSSLFSLDEVQNALRSLKASSSDQQLNHLAGTIAERKGQMLQAIKHYQKAAEQGCHRSIKRLVEHFAYKDDEAFSELIAQGVKHREPISTVVDLVFILATPEKAEAKSFKSAFISAKATSLLGFGFVEGLCYFNGYAGYAANSEKAAELMLSHYKKLPDFIEPAVLTFYVLLQADKKKQLVNVAKDAMRQLTKANKVQELARLELDLAFVLIELCGSQQSVAFDQTPKGLLQSAAKKGLPEAISFLAKTQARHLPKNTRATTKQRSANGNWASRLVKRSCSSQSTAA
ncbi:MAG: hypothetical protein K2W88_05515 [Pararheinheimera sp.]|nr:hypothetical protein [Rheinheimera sp.]